MKQPDIIPGQIKKIGAIILPKIKSDWGYSFTNRDLVLTALVQPSVKKIFSEIKEEFNSTSDFIIPEQALDLLESSPDRANSPAWIGESL